MVDNTLEEDFIRANEEDFIRKMEEDFNRDMEEYFTIRAIVTAEQNHIRINSTAD